MIELSPRVDLGHLLQAAVIIAGAVAFVITYGTRTSNTEEEVHQLRVDFATQMSELRKDVQTQNTQIPVMQTQLTAVASEVIRIETHDGQQDQTLGVLGEKTSVLRSDVDGLQRASGKDGPLARGR